MRLSKFGIICATFILVVFSMTNAMANTGELDKDTVNQSFQGTVVLRVDQRTGEFAMLQTDILAKTPDEAQSLSNHSFQTVPQDKITNELDRESGASSWYWYNSAYQNGYNHYYYNYGHCYYPWHSYSYGYYSYYYYNRYNYYF